MPNLHIISWMVSSAHEHLLTLKLKKFQQRCVLKVASLETKWPTLLGTEYEFYKLWGCKILAIKTKY